MSKLDGNLIAIAVRVLAVIELGRLIFGRSKA